MPSSTFLAVSFSFMVRSSAATASSIPMHLSPTVSFTYSARPSRSSAPCVVGVARGDGSLRRFRQAVVRSIIEYLRAILFSRTDNSHILTKETTMCQHALPLLYHVTCQEHPETPLCVGIIPTFRSSFIAKLQYSSS